MVERNLALLGQPIRPPVYLKYLGLLAVSLAAMAALPAVVALAGGETAFGWRALAVAILFGGLGLQAQRLEAPADMQPHEAMAVTATAFVLAGAGMAWPMTAFGLPWDDALFEAVSAITTTGLSMAPEPSRYSAAFLLCRSWMQWFGGLAIIVLATALILPTTNAGRQLIGESEAWDAVSSARLRSRRLLVVYAGLTLLAFGAIWACGASPFDALVHSLSGISTGGFSSHADSLAGLPSWPARLVVMLAAVLGAVSFSLQFRAWRGGWRQLLADRELRALVAACGIVAVVLVLTMRLSAGLPWEAALVHAPMLAVSAQTTAGFSTLAPQELDAGSKLALTAAMLVGGDTGSTAGGVKILRLLIVLRLLQLLLARPLLPRHAVQEARIAGRRLEPAEVQAAVAVVMAFHAVALLSWFAFVAAGHDPLNSLFEVVSALGTVGLSAGIATPELSLALKLLLCADMLMGRLEIVAFLILFWPRSWIGRGMART